MLVATVEFLGMDVGSWSSWFSGIMTAVGIYLAMKRGKINFEFHAYTSKKNELIYNVTNRSGYDVQAQAIGISVRKHRWRKSEIFPDINYYTGDDKKTEGVLRPNVMWHDSSSWANIPELTKRKWCYVSPFVVASDGATYYARTKRVRTKNFEDKDSK